MSEDRDRVDLRRLDPSLRDPVAWDRRVQSAIDEAVREVAARAAWYDILAVWRFRTAIAATLATAAGILALVHSMRPGAGAPGSEVVGTADDAMAILSARGGR
jgi:anti-sigma-K factor RskA